MDGGISKNLRVVEVNDDATPAFCCFSSDEYVTLTEITMYDPPLERLPMAYGTA